PLYVTRLVKVDDPSAVDSGSPDDVANLSLCEQELARAGNLHGRGMAEDAGAGLMIPLELVSTGFWNTSVGAHQTLERVLLKPLDTQLILAENQPQLVGELVLHLQECML